MPKYHFSSAKTIINVFIYFLLFIAGDLLASLIFDLVFSAVKLPASEWYIILRMSGCLLLTSFLFWLYTAKKLHLKMEDFGISLDIKLWGVVLSLLLPAFAAAVFLLAGSAEVNSFTAGEAALAVAASAVTALKAGITEEMLFRGFVMKLLESRWGKPAAILLPSFIFSLAHIPSMDSFTAGGIALLIISGTLVGVMFSLAAYRGGSVSNSALIHSVWNFVMVTSILHITTAQGAYGSPLVQITIPPDSVLLTGAGFGAEASVIAIAGYAIACAVLLIRRK